MKKKQNKTEINDRSMKWKLQINNEDNKVELEREI